VTQILLCLEFRPYFHYAILSANPQRGHISN
jgi:hypothetical protein